MSKVANEEGITRLVTGLQGLFENRTKTEAQAVALASTTPNTIYYTSDTHCIVVGGVVYGRGEQMASAFRYDSQSQTTQSWDTGYLYLVPSDTTSMYDVFAFIDDDWEKVGTEYINLETEASGIDYDDTRTLLGVDDVQGAIEEISVEVNGERGYYWKDMLREEGGLKTCVYRGYALSRTLSGVSEGDISATSNCFVFFFDVNPGEIWKMEGLNRNTTVHAYAFYDETSDNMDLFNGVTNSATNYYKGRTYLSIITSLHEHFISGDETPSANNTNYNTGEVTVPQGAKSMAVCVWYYGQTPGVSMNVYKRASRKSLGIAEREGRMIDGWSVGSFTNMDSGKNYFNDTLTGVYNIGDKVGILVNERKPMSTAQTYNGISGTLVYAVRNQGCRTVRVEVREGDKLLLDTVPFIKYGIVFTDYDYVITSLIEEKRLDGVYTCPNDGYAYISDVLYRDNWLYSKANGNLAYMAWDARKKGAYKKDDWYNEIALFEPIVVDYVLPSGTTFYMPSPYYTMSNISGRYLLIATRWTIGANMEQTTGSFFNIIGNAVEVNRPTVSMANAIQKGTFWTYSIYQDSQASFYNPLYVDIASVVANKRINYTIDRMFLHNFDDYGEAKLCGEAIADGTYDVSQEDGVITPEVDIALNAAGVASTAALGYDIFQRGAEMPVDTDGLAYGMALKGQAGRQFGSSTPANADKNLVYLPIMDWSGFTGLKASVFRNCSNLQTIPNITWEDNLIFSGNSFQNCINLKQVGDLKCNGYSTFLECSSLTKVGNITINTGGETARGSQMFQKCSSLEEIGTITGELTNCSNMFSACTSLKRVPALNTDNVTVMYQMFYNCTSLEETPVLSGTSNVTNMGYMFYGCVELKESPVIEVSDLCTNVSYMFPDCRSLETLHISGDFSAVTTTFNMFYRCSSLEEIDVDLNTEVCTTMQNMFNGCSLLRRVAGLDVSAVTTISSWFSGCTNLEELTITNLGKSSLTSYDFSALTKWGTTQAGHDTLYASLYTNSDPAQNITVKLSTNSYNALTQAERDNITSKGITLTK